MTDPKIRYDILANAQGEDDVRRLAAELEKLDGAVDPAAAERARELGERLRELGEQQAAIRSFVELKKETGEARQRLDEAQQAAQKLGQELAQTEKPTRAQAGQFEKLKDAVKASEAELQTKTRALDGARGKLTELGLSTEGLASKERDLRTATADVRKEIAELGQQGQAVQRFNELAQATEKARTELTEADKAVEAYRKELEASGEPTAAQARRLAELQQSANGAQQAFQAASLTQAEAASTLRAAGVDVERLTAAQGKLAPAQRQVADETNTATGALRENAGALGDVAGSAEGAGASLAAAAGQVAAAGAAIVGLSRTFGAATKASADFGSAMAEVSTLLDDGTDVEALGRAVEQLTFQYGGSAPEQARALYQIISAGATDAAQATELLEAANRLAIGGVTDVRTAADGLTSVLNAYGPAAGTAANVSDALFVAMRAGKTTIGELSQGLGQVAPLASQAGVSLDQLLAATAALTKGGVSTNQAITQTRAVISAVIKPTADAAKVAQELGLQFDAQALKSKDLAGFLEDVRQKTGGNTETMARLFGSVEALNAALTLTGTGAQDFGNIIEAQGRKAGQTGEAFDKLNETSAQAAQRFGAALEGLQRSLGDAITAFSPLLEAATKGLNLFNELPGPVRTTTAAVVAAAVAIPTLAAALGAVTRALGLATAAAGAKTAALATIAPAAAASATAVAGLGAASAAATPALAGAAGATTLLSRALGLLKLALPIGLVATVASLAVEFFRAKKGAEEADEAVRDMLEKPVQPVIPAAAKEAADATQEVADAATMVAEKLDEQAAAAKRAAEALGADLALSAGKVSEAFATKLERLDELVLGLDELERQGVQTGTLVGQALQKMVEAAANTQDLDALRQRVTDLGERAVITRPQVEGLLSAIEEKTKAAREEMAKLAGETTKATESVDVLAEAYATLGVKTAAELRQIAEDNRRAWQLIERDATASLAVKQAAFRRYAESALAANGGVVTDTLRTQAAAVDMGFEYDRQGRVIVRSLQEAAAAARDVERGTRDIGKAAAEAAQGYGLLSKAYQEARNARIAERAIPSIGDLIRATPSGGITRTAGVQFQPPDNSGDWVFDAEGYNRAVAGNRSTLSTPDPGRFWRLTPQAQQRRQAEQAAELAAARINDPGGFNGNAGYSPFGSADRRAAAQPVVPDPARRPDGMYEIRISFPNGAASTVTAGSRSQAEALIRELEEAFRQAGGG